MAIRSIGQLTLYDHNDAAPITTLVSASGGLSQTKTVNDTTQAASYSPDYTSVNNTLTAYVYSGSTNIAANLANRKWSLNDPAGSSLGSAVTYAVATNQDPDSASQRTYYFQGDYTDPVTGIVTHVMASIVLAALKTGTNAIFILIRGQTVIETSQSATKSAAKVWADLMQGGSVDDTSVTYKWFKYPYAAADQLDANHAEIAMYKFVATANIANGAWSVYASSPSDGTAADVKGLEIREDAVIDIGMYKVEAYRSAVKVAEQLFAISDISDPYAVDAIPSGGAVFQNGAGSKTLQPKLFYGNSEVTLDTSWSFEFELVDRFGLKSGFIDTAKTSAAKVISSNTAGITGSFVISVALAVAPVAGDVIRVISSDGLKVRSYEVGAGSTTTSIVIRSALNGFSTTAPTLNEFQNGKLWVYINTGAAAGIRTVAYNATCAATGDDIDGQAGVIIRALQA